MQTFNVTKPINAQPGDILVITKSGAPVVLNRDAYEELFGQRLAALPAPRENSSTKFVEEIRRGNSPVIVPAGDTLRAKILKTLAVFPGSSVQEIAEKGNINVASVYTMMPKLRAKKQLRARRRKVDGRYSVKCWYLTSEARQAITTLQ